MTQDNLMAGEIFHILCKSHVRGIHVLIMITGGCLLIFPNLS